MKDLNKEYEKHQISESISSKITDSEVVVLNMEDVLKRLYQEEAKQYKRLLYNHVLQKIGSVVEKFVELPDLKLVLQDEKCLEEMISIIQENEEMISEMVSLVDHDNYLDIAKLFDFIILYYTSNYSYLASKREGLKYLHNGIMFIDNRYDDTRTDIKDFFHSKIKKYQKDKVMVKEK